MGDTGEKEERGMRQDRRQFFSEIAKVAAAAGLTSGWPAGAFAQDGCLAAPESAGAFSSLSAELAEPGAYLSAAHALVVARKRGHEKGHRLGAGADAPAGHGRRGNHESL